MKSHKKGFQQFNLFVNVFYNVVCNTPEQVKFLEFALEGTEDRYRGNS